MTQDLAQLQAAGSAAGEGTGQGHAGGSGGGGGREEGDEEIWGAGGYDDSLNGTRPEEGMAFFGNGSGGNASVEAEVAEEEEEEPVMRPAECCASQKFRQAYSGRTWMGVRAFSVDLTLSQGNDGIAAVDTNAEASADHIGGEQATMGKGHELGRTSGYAAVSHGSTMLSSDIGDAITVEAWVLDRGMRPYTAYVSTAADERRTNENGQEEGSDYGFSLGIHDGQYTFELAGVKTKTFDRASAPKWMTMSGRRRWTHIAGTYDGEYLHTHTKTTNTHTKF